MSEARGMLYVNELYGPTVQGEGPHAGRPAMFLRLAGCNLACKFCDTPFSWDFRRFEREKEVHPMTPAAILSTLMAEGYASRRLVLTGGEPLLQQSAWAPLARSLYESGWSVEVETAGTIVPLDGQAVSLYVVSPKLSLSGNDPKVALRREALTEFAGLQRRVHRAVVWKFVARTVEDVDEVSKFCEAYSIPPRDVFILPEGKTHTAWLGSALNVVEHAVRLGYAVSPRMHITLWGTERGR